MTPELDADVPTNAARSAVAPGGGSLASVERDADRRDLRLQLMLLAFMLFWYGVFLRVSAPFADRNLDLIFNSMLTHLLHGQFDVDPGVVGIEGFLRNGHTYAYWGIWCALLRLPLWVFHRMNTDMTAWSCLAAVCLAAMAKVRAVLLLRRQGAHDAAAKHAVDAMLAYIVLGGSEIGYLKVSIYQEVVFWAVAFAALFVYFAVKGLVNRSFPLSTLNAMALCAGLAFLTRVSTGIGLILAFTLLLLVLAWQSSVNSAGERPTPARRWAHMLLNGRMLVPLGILAVFILATGIVNEFRWGNPLTFANLKLHLLSRIYTDRLPRLARYGSFNLRRIPFGLSYYFFPVWAVTTRSGNFLFQQTQTRLFEDVELPPSSFLLTDLLPVCFIAILGIALWRRRSNLGLPLGQLAAVATGLLAPCILMLTAISMTYRYRMEFYPEIDFLAFLGLFAILTDDKLRAIYSRRRIWIEAALIVSIASSLAALLWYFRTPFGPAQYVLHSKIASGNFSVF